MQEQHEMVLEKTYPSGADEWFCPTCGRRLLMVYGPTFQKTILEAGDEYVVHSGGKGGVSMHASQILSNEELKSEQDPHLSVWAEWLEERNFDDW
jgi:hypothetical protein